VNKVYYSTTFALLCSILYSKFLSRVVSLILAHRVGAYLLDQESQACVIVLDADDAQAWERLGHLARMLADEDVPSYLEKSRRGAHLWLFLAEAVTGREVRAFGQGLLAAHQIEGVELYPKQDLLADGPGCLIQMPFGVHRLRSAITQPEDDAARPPAGSARPAPALPRPRPGKVQIMGQGRMPRAWKAPLTTSATAVPYRLSAVYLLFGNG
jgi:hypothetical protein